MTSKILPVKLPDYAAYGLRHAPPELQRKVLAIFAQWPSNAGQSTPAYSKALHQTIEKLVQTWGGVWLNPDQGTRYLKLQCAQGHVWNTKPFLLRRGHWCSGCYVESLRSNIDAMQQLAAQYRGKCLSKTYQNDRKRLKWQCQYGHVWEAPPSSIKKGNWCSECNLKNKKARFFSEIQEIAAQKGGRCLSKEYIDNKAKLSFQCNKGHIWQTMPKSIRNSDSWCPVCRYDKRRLSLAYLHTLAANKGGLCLAKKYTTTNDKVPWQCAKGHIWETDGEKIRMGQWCPVCAQNGLRLTIQEMQGVAHSRGGKCLSTHYVNCKTKLLWECKLGHTWLATPGHIKHGTWCPSCYYLSRCKHKKSKRKYLPDKRID